MQGVSRGEDEDRVEETLMVVLVVANGGVSILFVEVAFKKDQKKGPEQMTFWGQHG